MMDITIGTQGYIGYNEIKNQIIVVFKGTSNLMNQLMNSQMDLIDYVYCTDC